MTTEYDKIINVANPAAGQNLSVAVPAGVSWELCQLSFLFTTSAAVAARAVSMVVTDATTGDELGAVSASGTQAASLAQVYNFSDDFTGIPIAVTTVNDRPRLVSPIAVGTFPLPQTTIIKTIIQLIQGADQISQVKLCVKERPNAPGYNV